MMPSLSEWPNWPQTLGDKPKSSAYTPSKGKLDMKFITNKKRFAFCVVSTSRSTVHVQDVCGTQLKDSPKWSTSNRPPSAIWASQSLTCTKVLTRLKLTTNAPQKHLNGKRMAQHNVFWTSDKQCLPRYHSRDATKLTTNAPNRCF